MVRPFESCCFSGHLAFSHGHYILNAGYAAAYDNIFSWEEPLQGYLSWKAGYKLYALNKQAVFHSWDRSFRPRFHDDAMKFKDGTKKQLENAKKKADVVLDNEAQSL